MKLIYLLALLLSLGGRAYSINFQFAFDNDPLPGLQAPLAGYGRFSFTTDPGDGTFPFSSLGEYSMAFAFPGVGAFFTEADIAANLDQVTVILSTGPLGRRLQFSDTGWGWFGLELGNSAGHELNFEPSWVGEGFRLYYVHADGGLLGDYLAQEVPDKGPTAGLLALSGLIIAGASISHRKSRAGLLPKP